MNQIVAFSDITVGVQASYSQTITDSDIKAFSGVSGDKNPIHMDDEYAEQSQFKRRIAHGLMSASFFQQFLVRGSLTPVAYIFRGH